MRPFRSWLAIPRILHCACTNRHICRHICIEFDKKVFVLQGNFIGEGPSHLQVEGAKIKDACKDNYSDNVVTMKAVCNYDSFPVISDVIPLKALRIQNMWSYKEALPHLLSYAL